MNNIMKMKYIAIATITAFDGFAVGLNFRF